MKTIVVDKAKGIGAALAEAEEGDVVIVPAGTYPIVITPTSADPPQSPRHTSEDRR